MRINIYALKLNSDRIVTIVKERGINYQDIELKMPNVVSDMLNNVFDANNLAEEHCWLIGTNSELKPLGMFEISHGSFNMSVMNPREIFTRLCLIGASSFILAHNHPSGNSIPSSEDIKTTKRIKEAGILMGINLLDHVVIGEDVNFSFCTSGLL